MTRNLVSTALLVALTGCQSLGDMGRSTADYIKEARNKPTPMERHLEDQRNPYKPLGTFDFSQDDSQSQACRRASYGRAVAPAAWEIVKRGSDAGNATCRHVLGTFTRAAMGLPRTLAWHGVFISKRQRTTLMPTSNWVA